MTDPEHLMVLKQRVQVNNKRQALSLAVAVLLLVISCGIPGLAAEPIPTPTVPIPSATPLPPSPTVLPTSAAPSLSVSAATPCLTGPSDLDEVVINLQAGEKAEITGESEGFWIVKTSDGSECWVADQGVTLEGDMAAVPNVEPPPTPEPLAPTPPANLQAISQTCTVDHSQKSVRHISEFHLTWEDMSNNEEGFHVYRDGILVAEVPADKTDVVDKVIRRNIRTYFYYVAAYNEVGESKGEVVPLICRESGGGGGGGGFGP
jgi:hypothetical protein